MTRAARVAALKRRRSLLLRAYVVHVGSFTSTCAFAATGSVHGTIAGSLWMVLVTIPPVLVYTALVDRSCRRIDPAAATVGWLKIALFTALLTPLESSLVLPARNLWIARRILRSCASAPMPDDAADASAGTRAGGLDRRRAGM